MNIEDIDLEELQKDIIKSNSVNIESKETIINEQINTEPSVIQSKQIISTNDTNDIIVNNTDTLVTTKKVSFDVLSEDNKSNEIETNNMGKNPLFKSSDIKEKFNLLKQKIPTSTVILAIILLFVGLLIWYRGKKKQNVMQNNKCNNQKCKT